VALVNILDPYPFPKIEIGPKPETCMCIGEECGRYKQCRSAMVNREGITTFTQEDILRRPQTETYPWLLKQH
jgi:hypothetical protein